MDGWPPNREFACPWLRRYVSMKWEKSPRVVLVLQDWGLADDESLKEAMKLLGERTGDRTIKAIFGIPRLKQAIASGSVCIMNAVWGLRRADKNKTGYLGDEVHRAAFPVWAAALKELSPTKVWLGGEWAKWPDLDWGKAEGGQRQIERWCHLSASSFYRISPFFCHILISQQFQQRRHIIQWHHTPQKNIFTYRSHNIAHQPHSMRWLNSHLQKRGFPLVIIR